MKNHQKSGLFFIFDAYKKKFQRGVGYNFHRKYKPLEVYEINHFI